MKSEQRQKWFTTVKGKKSQIEAKSNNWSDKEHNKKNYDKHSTLSEKNEKERREYNRGTLY